MSYAVRFPLFHRSPCNIYQKPIPDIPHIFFLWKKKKSYKVLISLFFLKTPHSPIIRKRGKRKKKPFIIIFTIYDDCKNVGQMIKRAKLLYACQISNLTRISTPQTYYSLLLSIIHAHYYRNHILKLISCIL